MPAAARTAASRLARSSRAANVRRRSPATSASRSGTASATISKMSARLRCKRLLLALPGRRALLEEGADALLGVGGHGVHRHHGLRQVVGLALVEVDLAVERLLPETHREGAG